MKIISKNDAMSSGLKKYFIGRKCTHGHISERYVANDWCVACRIENHHQRKGDPVYKKRILEETKRWRKANPKKYKKCAKNWRENNKDHIEIYSKIYSKKYYAANKDKVAAALKAWKENNYDRYVASHKEWRNKNPHKAREYYLKNKTEILKRYKKYRAMNKGKIALFWKKWYAKNSDRHKKKNMEYFFKNKNSILAETKKKYDNDPLLRLRLSERGRLYYVSNKDIVKKRVKAWQSNNPDKVKSFQHKNRATRKNVEGFFTEKDIQRIAKQQKYKCAYCYVNIKNVKHIDHIISIKMGGSNWPKNIQLTCPTHNMKKSSKDPLVFAREIGLLC